MLPAEIVTTVLVVAVALVLVATYVRRRLIAHGEALILCALRERPGAPWRLRLARLDTRALEVFSLGGFSLTPLERIGRGLDGLVGVETFVDDDPPLLVEPVVLRCTGEHGDLDLAVSGIDYTPLRSWLESSPPGIARIVA